MPNTVELTEFLTGGNPLHVRLQAMKHILIIDDDPVICRLVERFCNKRGFQVTVLERPTVESLDAACGVDLIILDLMMPELDGVECLRQFSAAKVNAPIIILSGVQSRVLTMAHTAAEAYGLTILGTLTKPLLPGALQFELQKIAYVNGQIPPGTLPPLTFTADEIEVGLDRSEFVVHYQPQVRTSDWSLCGVEALVRWAHPAHGVVSPGAFIPVIENSWLARAFTVEVVSLALADAQNLTSELGYTGMMSVNLPPSILNEARFADEIIALLNRSGFEPTRLQFEITEGSLSSSISASYDIETRLAMRGIHLSIDDFGTGHSGLERLRTTPFNELKIDRSFVMGALDSPINKAIVTRMIQLGHDLGMTVVAEGVETVDQLRWLCGEGCDIIQGYFVAPPMSYVNLKEWIQKELPSLPLSMA